MTAIIDFQRLRQALAHAGDTYSLVDIEKGVASGRFQEWSAGSSVIITELRDTPQVRFLHFFLAAGTLTELRPLAELALKWGREQGASRASFVGRFGWLKSFVRDLGFTEVGTYMEARL